MLGSATKKLFRQKTSSGKTLIVLVMFRSLRGLANLSGVRLLGSKCAILCEVIDPTGMSWKMASRTSGHEIDVVVKKNKGEN